MRTKSMPRSPTPSQLTVIAVATPAISVAGNGPWTTLQNDIILLVAPNALRANVQNSNTPGYCVSALDIPSRISCHSFTDSYLIGDVSGPRILDEVVAEVRQSPAWQHGPKKELARFSICKVRPRDGIRRGAMSRSSCLEGITVTVRRWAHVGLGRNDLDSKSFPPTVPLRDIITPWPMMRYTKRLFYSGAIRELLG